MDNNRRPYLLPIEMTCDPRKVESGVNMELVKYYIDWHKQMMPRYDYLEKLYEGFHDIFNAPEKEDWKPDHRLAVNFPRFITETFCGYTYGIPIKVTHQDKTINDSLQSFAKNNEMTDHNEEMSGNCCIFGHGYEYMYQNEDAKSKLKAFTPKDLFIVYDNKIDDKALFAVRYGYYTDDKNRQRLHGEVMTRAVSRYFDGTDWVDEKENPYGYIPVVEWRLNEKRMGLFEPAASLVEEFNLIISEKGNDVAAFAEAYLAILGAEVDDEGVHRIRDDRIINIYGTDDAKDVLVQFLTKPTADGTQENLLDRLQDLIFLTCMVANISDENFGNNTSGVALAYKLMAMDNLAKTFDRKVEKSLKKRYKIFCSLPTNVSNEDAWEDIDIIFTRNVPKNLEEEARTAQALDGTVSKETTLSTLSIVDDPKEEMKKIQEETDEERKSAAEFGENWRNNNAGNENDKTTPNETEVIDSGEEK